MENIKAVKITKLLLGMLLMSIILDIPHLLFGFDLLSIFSIFFTLCIGFLFFFRALFLFRILLLLYGALLPFMCLSYFIGKIELGEPIWKILLATNLRESYEMLTEYILPILVSVIVIALFLWFLSGNVIRIVKHHWRGLILLGFSGIFGLLICTFLNAKINYGGNYLFGFKFLQPFNYPSTLLYTIKRNKVVTSFANKRNAYSFGIRKLDSITNNPRKIIVLVIGESSRYDHWSINGYERETSPLLKNKKQLYSFMDVAAPATGTIYSIPLIMTASDPYKMEDHYQNKGVIDAFKEALFKTIYLTNQEENKDGLYREEYHYQNVDSFINTDRFFKEKGLMDNQYDEKLLPHLDNVLQTFKNGNLFICIHLMGSHNNYSKRFPKSFAKFKNDGKLNNKYGYNDEIANYDNSILYTDYILSEIIRRLEDMDGSIALLFTADHGENLKDDAKKQTFHTVIPDKYTAHIPYFIWLNNTIMRQNPSYDSLLKAHINYPLSASDNTLFTLLQLADLYPSNEAKRFKTQNLLSNDLIYSEQKIYDPYKQKIKYSDLLKN